MSNVNAVNLGYGTALANTPAFGHGQRAGQFQLHDRGGRWASAGNGQSEDVTFTPTDSLDYNTAPLPLRSTWPRRH